MPCASFAPVAPIAPGPRLRWTALVDPWRRVILVGMTHRVGPKGQVVIPKDIRDRLGIAPGTEVVFTEDAGGVVVRPAAGLAGLRGSLAQHDLAGELARGRAEDDAARARRR